MDYLNAELNLLKLQRDPNSTLNQVARATVLLWRLRRLCTT